MAELETKLGDLLKLERERQGKDLKTISEQLRIAESALRSIEAGNVEALPSTVYYNLFAKTYAESLGIDYTATVDAIREDIGEPEPVEARKPKRGAVPPPAKQQGPKPAAKVPAPPQKEEPQGQAETEAEEPAAKKPRIPVYAYAAAAVLIAVAGYFLFTRVLSETDMGRELIGGDAAAERNEELYAEYDWAVPTYRPGDSLRLSLDPRGESWATVIADGDTVLFQNLVPGRGYRVSARYRMLVSVAVPQVVEIRLNDQLIDIVSPETGRISRMEINQANFDSIINPAPEPTEQAPSTGDSVTPDDGRL